MFGRAKHLATRLFALRDIVPYVAKVLRNHFYLAWFTYELGLRGFS